MALVTNGGTSQAAKTKRYECSLCTSVRSSVQFWWGVYVRSIRRSSRRRAVGVKKGTARRGAGGRSGREGRNGTSPWCFEVRVVSGRPAD